MSKEHNVIMPMILKELPEHDRREFTGIDMMDFLEKKYGKPQLISSSLLVRESVFNIEGKKIGIIEDASLRNVTGFSVYRGDIPDAFIQKQQGTCTNGYNRTSTVTTTSPMIVVSYLGILGALGQIGVVAALAVANLIAHVQNVSAAKTAACAPCVLPCTCTATTVAGSWNCCIHIYS